MTKKQVRKTLINESLIYIILAAIASLSLGTLLSYIGIKIVVSKIWFFTLNFTIVLLILVAILIVKLFVEESII